MYKSSWTLHFDGKGIVFSFHCSTSNYCLDSTIIQKGLRTRYVQLQFLYVYVYIYIYIYDSRSPTDQDIANSFKVAPGRIGLSTHQNAAAAEAAASETKGGPGIPVWLLVWAAQPPLSPHNLVSNLSSSDGPSSAGAALNAAASCCIVQCRHPWEAQGRAAHHLGTAAVKLWDHSQPSGQNTHLNSSETQRGNPGKDPQQSLFQVDNSTIPKKEAAAANYLLPTSLKIETLPRMMMMRISAQLVCIPRKGHFSSFTGCWNTGRVQGNVIHIRIWVVKLMLNLSPYPPPWHSNNLSEIQTWRT